MKKLVAIGLTIVICLLCVACGSGSVSDNSATEAETKTVYTDESISVDFVKVSDSAVAGNFEMYIKAQNNTDKDITVYLKDVTINGSAVQIGSGVPCDIVAGANRTHGFFGRLDLAGVSSSNEITKITFKVWVVDKDFNTIITTTDLEVEI